MELDINRIKTQAQAIVNGTMLARIDLTNITPTRIGGYNARPYSKELDLTEGLRTSEVKGIWRWWLRATLAGALWDLGKEPSEKTIKEMVYGMLGSTASTSRFTLTTSYMYSSIKRLDDLRRIPRMHLILMGRRGESQNESNIRSLEEESLWPPGFLTATLSLHERAGKTLDGTTRRLAFGTLLLALLLHGVGAITRRGFGRFQLEVKECAPELMDYSNSIKAINGARNKMEMENNINNLLKIVFQDAEQSLLNANVSERLTPRSSRLPRFPLLSRDSRFFRLQVVDVEALDEITLLESLGRASMKARWKDVLGLYVIKRSRRIPLPGGVLDSWILGLPREVQETGYKSQVGRRPSAIILAPVKKLPGSFLVAIYGFLSSDWPIGSLKWAGGPRGQRRLYSFEDISKDSHLLNALKNARDGRLKERIEECVRKKGEERIECAFNLAFELVRDSLLVTAHGLQRRHAR